MGESLKKNTRTWRPVAQVPQRRGESTRRFLIALVGACLLVIGGVLIALLLVVDPLQRAFLLPLCLSEYDDDFPVRNWVQRDSDALRCLGWEERNAFTNQERDPLLQALRKAAQSDLSGPLVVYLNAYSLSNPQGELCILPVDARLDRPESWLPLRTVFQLLSESRTKHKLLLLDIMQPFMEPRQGLLLNDAAERLQPLLNEYVENDPHLSVLCACAPGQDSIVAEELGHSVFAYFLYEGLRGQADGKSENRKTDGRVSLQELAAYVTAQVEQWTLRHRQVGQTPRLHGAASDYPLVSLDAQTAPPLEPPDRANYPDWLQAGWKQRDEWLKGESQRPTQELHELESSLLRAEQRWRGGFSEEQVHQVFTSLREKQRSQRLAAARSRAIALPADPLKSYQGLNVDLEAVKQAKECFEELLVLLPCSALYLEVDTEAETVWEKAVTKVCELRPLLAAPPGDAPEVQVRKMMTLTAALRNDRNNLNRLRLPLNRDPFDRLIGRRRGGDDADLKRMTALLATPWPTAEQRSKLWAARRELLVDLLTKRPVAKGKAGDEAQAIAAQHRRAVQRARRSVQLLQLEGAAPLEKVEKALAEAAEVPTDKARLRVLGAELNQAWKR